MEFEKEFDIQIPDDQAENIATVGQATYIEEAKNKDNTRLQSCIRVLLFFKIKFEIDFQSKLYLL
jgi:uncharacterized membrane protein